MQSCWLVFLEIDLCEGRLGRRKNFVLGIEEIKMNNALWRTFGKGATLPLPADTEDLGRSLKSRILFFDHFYPLIYFLFFLFLAPRVARAPCRIFPTMPD